MCQTTAISLTISEVKAASIYGVYGINLFPLYVCISSSEKCSLSFIISTNLSFSCEVI